MAAEWRDDEDAPRRWTTSRSSRPDSWVHRYHWARYHFTGAPKWLVTNDDRTSLADRPENYREIEAAIEKSRAMLDWDDNWDDEGSPGYAETTWHRARNLILKNVVRLWQEQSITIPPPRVLPGSYGSIDIHWRTEHYEVLVNVPAADEAKATYYGDDRAQQHVVKGALDPSTRDEWFLWLLTRLAQ